jgi:protein-L-isoaspartate(D-aspartate) O-methyltransferase
LPTVADRIYVNFSVGRPAEGWIEGLATGGRLIFPLGVPTDAERPDAPRFARRGAAFAIDRTERGFAASWICPAFFVWGEGSGFSVTKASSEALERAFEDGGGEFVRKLSWRKPAEPMRCWFHDTDWSLGYDEA